MSNHTFFSRLRQLAAAIVAVTASATLAQTADADAENYRRTLGSTTWVIASDAEDNTSSGTGVLVCQEDEARVQGLGDHAFERCLLVGARRKLAVGISNGEPIP